MIQTWQRGGYGEPLLLLHGIGTSAADFTGLRPLLEQTYTVFSVDLPGHGQSPTLPHRPTVAAVADVLEADLDRLGLSRVHVLGDSLGARLALELARRGRALSVVAIAPSGLNAPGERVLQALAMGGARLALRSARPLLRPLSRRRVGRIALLTGLRGRPWTASEPEAFALKSGFAEAKGFWRLLWYSILTDMPHGLEEIDCPVLLAQGTRDFISVGQTPRYLFAVPGSTFQPIVAGGHAPMSDTPQQILRLVNEAVARADTSSSATLLSAVS